MASLRLGILTTFQEWTTTELHMKSEGLQGLREANKSHSTAHSHTSLADIETHTPTASTAHASSGVHLFGRREPLPRYKHHRRLNPTPTAEGHTPSPANDPVGILKALLGMIRIRYLSNQAFSTGPVRSAPPSVYGAYTSIDPICQQYQRPADALMYPSIPLYRLSERRTRALSRKFTPHNSPTPTTAACPPETRI